MKTLRLVLLFAVLLALVVSFPPSMLASVQRGSQAHDANSPVPPSKPNATNLALGKTATASSYYNNSVTFDASKVNDGSYSTWWASNPGDSDMWVEIDLGQAYTLTEVNFKWEVGAKSYAVEGSSNNSTWTTIQSGTNATNGQIDDWTISATYRYLRIHGTPNSPTITYFSIYEFEVYGPKDCYANVSNGDWSSPSTWGGCDGGSGVPGAADNVTISSGQTVNVTGGASAKNISVYSGGHLNITNSLQLYGNLRNDQGMDGLGGGGWLNVSGNNVEFCTSSTNLAYFQNVGVVIWGNPVNCSNPIISSHVWVNAGTLIIGAAPNSLTAIDVASGATLDLGSFMLFSTTVTNAGTIKHLDARNVTSGGSSIDFYDHGNWQVTLEIQQTGGASMGYTSVQVNAGMPTSGFACGSTTLGGNPAKRYFDIAPTGNSTNVTATLTLYFYSGASNSEANGNTSNMAIYHCKGGTTWERLNGTYSEGTSGNYTWVKLTGYNFTSFSPFTVGGGPGNPTAVTLSSFQTNAPTFDLGAWLRKFLRP